MLRQPAVYILTNRRNGTFWRDLYDDIVA